MSEENPSLEQTSKSSPLWRRDVMLGVAIGLAVSAFYFFGVVPSRENRYRANCQSNLKQVGLARLQYITDYDEKYPLPFTDGDGSGQFDSAADKGWTQAMEPYLKAPHLYQCPPELHPQKLSGGPVPGYTDFFYNGKLQDADESDFEFIAKTICMGEHKSDHAAATVSSTRQLDETAKARHLAGANYAFLDGHVKWLQPEKLSDGDPATVEYSFRYK